MIDNVGIAGERKRMCPQGVSREYVLMDLSVETRNYSKYPTEIFLNVFNTKKMTF